jgi:hypothetical protein
MSDYTYTFVEGRLADARDLIAKYHYSHREKSCPIAVGVLAASRPDLPPIVVAACVFTISTAKWSIPVAELQRLVRHPDYRPPLTMLISRTVRVLKCRTNCPAVAISYADATHGHHGGVYQAASWNYSCQRPVANDGLTINGSFVPGRSCNATWGTRSAGKLARLHPDWAIAPHYDMGKHLYWIPLNKTGQQAADTLGLKRMPYPKPNPASEVTPATRPPIQVGEGGSTPTPTLNEGVQL